MNEIEEKDIFKKIGNKFPVCNVIDYRAMDGEEIASKCGKSQYITEIKRAKKMYDVTICTGSFNVYVIKIEERV